MKKYNFIAVFLSIVLLLASLSITAVADGVPQAVLDATASVVRILVENRDGYYTGSGFVISNSSVKTLIVTNNHVIGSHPINISVWSGFDSTVSAKVVVANEQNDLCILEIYPPLSLDVLPLEEKELSQGEAVYAVGYPSASDYLYAAEAHTSESATITNGIISAVGHTTLIPYGPDIPLLQINAAINPGNSGGPLFNSNGRVVGINTLKASDSEGIFGAISVSELIKFMSSNGIEYTAPKASHTISPWIWIITAAASTVICCITAIIIKRRHAISTKAYHQPTVTLREFISQNGPLTDSQSVSLLMPVARQLRDMHNDGQMHLQISPDSVVVRNGIAALNAPTSTENDKYSNGFASPEIYRGKNNGGQSDIYSFCALLSYTINAISPPNALERAETDFSSCNFDSLDSLTEIINKGMSTNPEQRFANVQDLIYLLTPFNTGSLATLTPTLNSSPSNKNEHTSSKNSKNRESQTNATQCIKAPTKLSKKCIAILVVIVILTLLGAVSTFYCVRYHNAVSLAENHEFCAAKESLLFGFITQLHDCNLIKFIEAGVLLENQDFENAEIAFSQLGAYRGADSLALETRCIWAKHAADNGDFEQATAILAEPIALGYIPAYNALANIQYQHMHSLWNKGKLLEAYDMLCKFDDSDKRAAYISALQNDIYLQGQILYREGKYNDSYQYFSAISGYEHSSTYEEMILYHWGVGSLSIDELINFWRMENDPLIKELIIGNGFVDYLEGSWQTQDMRYYLGVTNGKFTFSLPVNNPATSTSFSSYTGEVCPDFNLSFREMMNFIHNNPTVDRGYLFKIDIIDADTICVFCRTAGQTYTLYRQ